MHPLARVLEDSLMLAGAVYLLDCSRANTAMDKRLDHPFHGFSQLKIQGITWWVSETNDLTAGVYWEQTSNAEARVRHCTT